jgi:hypothetical protein
VEESGSLVGLVKDDLSPESIAAASQLTYAGDADEFLASWRWNDWNKLTIRCVGEKPIVTTWINDVKVAEIDLAQLVAPDYDADAVAERLGSRGHIALEVHDNDPMLGGARWAPGAACRWRNLVIREL